MKTMVLCLALAFTTVSCGLANKIPTSAAPAAAATPILQMLNLNTQNSQALFRSSSSVTTTNQTASDSVLNSLYAVQSDGSYQSVTYAGNDGLTYPLNGDVSIWSALNNSYGVIALTNGAQGLVTLADGRVLPLQAFNFDLDTLTVFANKVFAYTSDLRTLRSIDLQSGQVTTYLTLGNNQSFVKGTLIPVSTTDIWWSNDGSTVDTRKNYRPFVVDRNLNVLAQVETLSTSTTQLWNISPAGQNSVNPYSFNLSKFMNFYYTSDNRLLSVASNSGFYNYETQNIAANAVDLTVSEVLFAQSGMTMTSLQQITPYQSSKNEDNAPIPCRSTYSIDSSKRYVLLGWGVVTYDASQPSAPLSFAEADGSMNNLFNNANNPIPELSCFIAGDYVYYLNGARTQIYRTLLTNIGDMSSETLVIKSDIQSFYIIGNDLFYSGSSGSFQNTVDGSNEMRLTTRPVLNVNDIVQIEW